MEYVKLGSTGMEDSAGAVKVSLTREELAYLEEPYVPHKIVGPISVGMQLGHALG